MHNVVTGDATLNRALPFLLLRFWTKFDYTKLC